MKRLCALLFAVCLMVGALVFPADAAVTEGTYGDYLTWRFDEATGTLTISGTGTATKLFYAGNGQEIDDLRLRVTHLVFEDGITAVGKTAFTMIPYMKSIRLADSVKTLGEGAFNTNYNVTELYLGNGVETIGVAAFMELSSLRKVVLPESIKTIGAGAFSSSGLTGFVIPESITTIEDRVFYGCVEMTAVMIPASVTKIKYGAFSACDKLTDVYYGGTQQQWEAIAIDNTVDGKGESNGALFSATIHYNHSHTWETSSITGGSDL